MMRIVPIFFFLYTTQVFSSNTVIYFSPTGNDQNPGTTKLPLKSPNLLNKILKSRNEIKEVIFYKGVYQTEVRIDSFKIAHPLLIRNYKNDKVVFDGGKLIESNHVEKIKKGVFRTKGLFSKRFPPRPWEEDTRTRYQEVEDIDSVKAIPATYCITKDYLYFHTSDDKNVSQHKISYAFYQYGLFVRRANTTIQGIHFRNYQARYRSSGVSLRSSRIKVTGCDIWNCRTGVEISSKSHDCIVEKTKISDCGGGVYSNGKNTVTRFCTIIKKRDNFLTQTYPQDDTGIQYYYPAIDGRVDHNVIAGFNKGVFFKANGNFHTEFNTVVKCNVGVQRSNNAAGDVFRYNILYECNDPFQGSKGIKPGTIFDYNCLWKVTKPQALADIMNKVPIAGTGRFNIVANPLFANIQKGDYRLLPQSPLTHFSPNTQKIGALAKVPDHYKDQAPPILSVSVLSPAKPMTASGTLDFEIDPWNGGGKNFIKEVLKNNDQNRYITKENVITFDINAEDNYGICKELKFKINDKPWIIEKFSPKKTIKLPTAKSTHRILFQVNDLSNQWSEIISMHIHVSKKEVQLSSPPKAYSNIHGVVLVFKTSQPSTAEVLFSHDQSFREHIKASQPIYRRWDTFDGGEWVTSWKEYRKKHHIPIVSPKTKPNTKYFYKIKMSNQIGNTTTSKVFSFETKGKARSFYVGTSGKNNESYGATPSAPFASLQFAINRALPGDQIILQPGLYTEPTYIRHGGLAGSPIRIKGSSSSKVVLDGARRVDNLIYISNSPFVHISGLTIRGFSREGAGIYIVDSHHVTVDHCRIRNGLNEDVWPVGYGIFAHRSPHLNLHHNLILKNEWGMCLLECPYSLIKNNTGFRNLYYALGLIFSTNRTQILNNSFSFNDTEAINIYETDTAAFQSLKCDYNNLATHIGLYFASEETESVRIKDPIEKGGSKCFITCELPGISNTRFRSFANWQSTYQKDKNSIISNPDYTSYDPLNFHLLPNSPNIGSGKNKVNIGAFGVNK